MLPILGTIMLKKKEDQKDVQHDKEMDSLLRLSRGLLPGLVFVFILWLATPIMTVIFVSDVNRRGEAGDMFGSVNSLFAGLAFAGVIYSVRLQQHDLRILRKEADRTKALLEEGQKNNAAQIALTKQANFESTLFKLLETFLSITTALELRERGGSFTGRQSLAVVVKQLQNSYRETNMQNADLSDEDAFYRAYEMTYKQNDHVVGGYFTCLAAVLRFIDNADFDMTGKLRYSDMVRSVLSPNEATLLVLHYIGRRGQGDLNRYILKYRMVAYAKVSNPLYLLFAEKIPADAFALAMKKHLSEKVFPFIDEKKAAAIKELSLDPEAASG